MNTINPHKQLNPRKHHNVIYYEPKRRKGHPQDNVLRELHRIEDQNKKLIKRAKRITLLGKIARATAIFGIGAAIGFKVGKNRDQ